MPGTIAIPYFGCNATSRPADVGTTTLHPRSTRIFPGAIDRALAAARAVPPPTAEDLFEHTYAELTQRQARQLREYAL